MPKVQIKPIETDTEENALDSLEMSAEFLSRSDMKHQWKWVSIALFNALYGFCIAAIRGTNPDRVLKSVKCKSCKKIFAPNDIQTNRYKCPHCTNPIPLKFDEIQLIGFSEAFERVQEDRLMRQFVFSKTLTFSDDQKKSVEALRKRYRNEFEHLKPYSWVFPEKDIKIVSDVIDVIEKLVLESGNIAHHLEKDGIERFTKAIEKIKGVMSPKNP